MNLWLECGLNQYICYLLVVASGPYDTLEEVIGKKEILGCSTRRPRNQCNYKLYNEGTKLKYLNYRLQLQKAKKHFSPVIVNRTTVIRILQPAPETYEIFLHEVTPWRGL